MTQKSKLNHLNLSQMALPFSAILCITEAAAKSKSLCALHLSGNQVSPLNRRILARILEI